MHADGVLTRSLSLYTIRTDEASDSAANLEAEAPDSASRHGIGGSGDNGRGGEATHNVRERDVGVNEGGVVAAGLPLLELSVVVHGPKLAYGAAAAARILLPPPHGQHPTRLGGPTRATRRRLLLSRHPPPSSGRGVLPSANRSRLESELPDRRDLSPGAPPDRRIGGLRIGDREIRTGAYLSLSPSSASESRGFVARENFFNCFYVSTRACLLCYFLRFAPSPPPSRPSLLSGGGERGSARLRAVPFGRGERERGAVGDRRRWRWSRWFARLDDGFSLGMCPLLPARWLRVSVRLGRWLRLQLSFLVINSTR
jgi:hypothetical protein